MTQGLDRERGASGAGALHAGSPAFARYEAELVGSRARFLTESGLAELLSSGVDPRLLELFLLDFCALGVGMTEPVDGWIRRAGERCLALGFEPLGRMLMGHAGAEAGHHQLMISDARRLADLCNRHRRAKLEPEALIQRRSPGVARYHALHERTVTGSSPFAQLAIEYEIEALSLDAGQRLLACCASALGEDIGASLSFLSSHIELDTGHTRLNARQMELFLKDHPDHLGALVEAGKAALETYAGFLRDCIQLAREQREELP